jgi:hypothetical protein
MPFQLVEHLSDDEETKWKVLCEYMIERFEVDETFGNYLIFIFLEIEQEECSRLGNERPHDTTI